MYEGRIEGGFGKRGVIQLLMEKRRQSEVIKERAVRHNRLMKLIKSYARTEEETRKLERIKMNTMMEINIRYLRSEHNRHYRFPKRLQEDSDEEEEPNDDPLARRENITYDLMTQNQLPPGRALSHKVLSLDSSRKVTSLEIERTHWQRDRILRLNLKGKQQSSKAISRKNSLSDKRREGSKLKLPELKTEKSRENLKTEAKGSEEEREIQSVIGKKLATESSESTGKMRGVEKYLRTIQGRQKENELKGNFKRKMFLPDKVS